MKYSKEQRDYIIHALEHCEILTGGRSETLELIKQQEEEIERLNNIINEALGIANERFNYYSNHKNNNQEHLEDWGNIFNILLRRDDK